MYVCKFPSCSEEKRGRGVGVGEGGRMGEMGGCVCGGVGGTEEEGEDRKPMEPSSHLIPLVCSFCGIKKHAEGHLL